MKKLLTGALSVMLLAACGGSNDSYVLTGSIQGAQDGDTVKLVQFEGWDVKEMGTSVIQNGRFTFEGRQDTAAFYYISYVKDDANSGTCVLLENGKIDVEIDPNSYNYKLTGTPVSEAWADFDLENERICSEAMELYRTVCDTTQTQDARDAAGDKLEAKEKEIADFRLKFCRDNIGNMAGVYALVDYCRNFPEEETERLVGLIPASCETAMVKQMKQEIEQKKATKTGQPFMDFSMPSIDGGTLSVAEVVKSNKVTMIDFWASWCGPCRAEMPVVKAAYDRFHDKGFEIVGVSLDNDDNAWKQAVKDLDLPWKHMSDLKGWACEGAALYGVKAIPATVLIVDGKIVARDLRGEAVERELEKLLAD